MYSIAPDNQLQYIEGVKWQVARRFFWIPVTGAKDIPAKLNKCWRKFGPYTGDRTHLCLSRHKQILYWGWDIKEYC